MRYRLFLFLTAAVIAAGIGACGGEGKSSDPLGTDSITFGDSSGSAVLRLDPNEAVQLTATVRDAAGNAVAEREVFFDFVVNASGATLTSSKVSTTAGGEATILYRAGAASGADVVRAAISSETKMDVSITVGVGGGITGNRISSLTSTPSTLPTSSGTSIVTATAVQADGVTPVPGVTVTFSLVKGLGTIVPPAVVTNGSGQANAIFTGPGGAAGFEAVRAQILGTTTGDAVVIINW